MKAKPFLKWAGGKTSSLEHLRARLPQVIDTYYEPFVGGGALFFALAAERRFEQAVIGDANLRLVRTYVAIRDDVEVVIELLKRMVPEHSPAFYQEMRARDVDDEPDYAVAARFIYLNKTCFNGLYRENKSGKFNVPMGNYKNPLICDEETLRACSHALQWTTIKHGDFSVFPPPGPGLGDVVYFDPPYVPLSDTSYFTAYTKDGFGPDEQIRLRDTALELRHNGACVVLSNHDTPWVREIYEDFPLESVAVGRAINARAAGRGAVRELVIGGWVSPSSVRPTPAQEVRP